MLDAEFRHLELLFQRFQITDSQYIKFIEFSRNCLPKQEKKKVFENIISESEFKNNNLGAGI